MTGMTRRKISLIIVTSLVNNLFVSFFLFFFVSYSSIQHRTFPGAILIACTPRELVLNKRWNRWEKQSAFKNILIAPRTDDDDVQRCVGTWREFHDGNAMDDTVQRRLYGGKRRPLGMVSLARGRRGEMRSSVVCALLIAHCRRPAREPRTDHELLAATDAIRNEFSARALDTAAFRDNRTDG